MSLETIALAVLSGGLVAALFKSLAERTERFREKMLDAGDSFLTKVQMAQVAIDDAGHAVVYWATARSVLDGAFDRLTDASTAMKEPVPDAALDVMAKARAVALGPSPVFSPSDWAAETSRTRIQELEIAVEQFRTNHEGVEPLSDAFSVLLVSLERSAAHATEVDRSASIVRSQMWEAEQAYARLTLMFGGRWGVDAVLNAADDLLNALRTLRSVLQVAVRSDTPEDEFNKGTEAATTLMTRSREFGGAVGASVRRAWL